MAAFAGQTVVNPKAVAAFMRSPDGPVLRALFRAGHQVKDGARRQVGVHEPTPGERRVRRPGTLRDSIVVRIVASAARPTVLVGSNDPIARIHHEGTPAHPIRAVRKPMLVFYWRKVGHVVAFKKVNHPGTSPNRYLTDQLRRVVGKVA